MRTPIPSAISPRFVMPILQLSAALLCTAPVWGANWSGWRGGDGTGVSKETGVPIRWSDKENVRWRTELPSAGNGSPIVWKDRVFIAQAVPGENRRTLMCFDLATGKLLWQSGVTYTEPEQTQENNPYCAGTPATDGERVYVCLGSPGVFAYDLSGKEVWHRDLGKLSHMFGTAVSPVLYGDLCIVNFGPGENARLIALNRKTGETVWEAKPPQPDPEEQQQGGPGRGGPGGPGRPGGPGGPGAPGGAAPAGGPAAAAAGAPGAPGGSGAPAGGPGGPGGGRGGPGGPGGPGGGRGPGGRGGGGGGGSWSTPAVIRVNGHDELIASMPFRVVAYEPATGKQLWVSKGIGGAVYATPLWNGETLVASSGGPAGGSAIGLKPGGSGDVSESGRVWRVDRVKNAFGTGVVHDGHVYAIGNDGIAQCYEIATGKTVWQERLNGSGSQSESWSSMILAEGRIYVPNRAGDVIVLKAAPKFEVLSVNPVGESANTSLATADHAMVFRTSKALWCFGALKN